jgi:L,D-transpeptidase catalytic domain
MKIRTPTSFAFKLSAPLVLLAALGGPLVGQAAADAGAPTAVVPAASTATSPTPATASSASSTTTTSTTTATTPTTTTTTPPKAAPAVKGSAAIFLPDAFVVHHQAVTVPTRVVHVRGVVKPYVAGQSVEVKAFLGRRLIKSARLRVKRARSGAFGQFTMPVAAAGPGTVSVLVTHDRTSAMSGFEARRSYASLGEHVGFGSTGPFVQLIQQRLAALHIYVIQSGVYDQHTALAVDAYHRLLRRGSSQSLDGRTISSLLDGFGQFKVRFPKQGRHAEGSLSDQLLALIIGSRVQDIYPISSGKPSTPTVLGNFRIYARVPSYLPDGMYYSSFFFRGYAIHGFDPAPDFPASHGCVRLPISDAISAFNWLGMGDGVDVYY